MPKLVSLITTVYNGERYLDEAIQSVINQTYKHWELLIWDDGSCDRTLEIALNWRNRDRRIIVYNYWHRGRYLSLSEAHKYISGKLIGWLDADDLLHPECLEQTVNFYNANRNYQLIYTQYQNINKSGKVLGNGRRCNIPYSRDRLLWDFMTYHFRLYTRSLYQKIGGIDGNYECCGDYDFCLKASEVTDIYHLPIPLYYYRLHDKSTSALHRKSQIIWGARAIQNACDRRGLNYVVALKDNRIYLLDKSTGQVQSVT